MNLKDDILAKNKDWYKYGDVQAYPRLSEKRLKALPGSLSTSEFISHTENAVETGNGYNYNEDNLLVVIISIKSSLNICTNSYYQWQNINAVEYSGAFL